MCVTKAQRLITAVLASKAPLLFGTVHTFRDNISLSLRLLYTLQAYRKLCGTSQFISSRIPHF